MYTLTRTAAMGAGVEVLGSEVLGLGVLSHVILVILVFFVFAL
jgi:hypothetical protein